MAAPLRALERFGWLRTRDFASLLWTPWQTSSLEESSPAVIEATGSALCMAQRTLARLLQKRIVLNVWARMEARSMRSPRPAYAPFGGSASLLDQVAINCVTLVSHTFVTAVSPMKSPSVESSGDFGSRLNVNWRGDTGSGEWRESQARSRTCSSESGIASGGSK